MTIAEKVAASCQEAFLLGLHQPEKKQMTHSELMKKITWLRGKYQPIFWAAYKSGLWTRNERNAEQAH